MSPRFTLISFLIAIAFFEAVFSFDLNKIWCSSCDDPHIRTFDGRLYDFHYSGDFFVMYNDFEETRVTASYRPCNKGGSKPTCNCGVHIKFKNSLMFLDICGSAPSASLAKQFFVVNPPMNNIPEPAYCGDKFVPGGKETDDEWWNTPGNAVNVLTRRFLCATSSVSANIIIIRTNDSIMNKNIYVKVTVHDRGISCIYIRPSLNSYGSTGGLCGTFNQKPNDDISIYDPKTCKLVLAPISALVSFWQLTRRPPPEFPSLQLDSSTCPCDPIPLPPGVLSNRCVKLLVECATNFTIVYQDYIRSNLIKPVSEQIAVKFCGDLFRPTAEPLLTAGLVSRGDFDVRKRYCISDYQATGDAFWGVNQLEEIFIEGRQSCLSKKSPVCTTIQKPAKCLFPDYAALFTDGQPYEPCPRVICHPKVL